MSVFLTKKQMGLFAAELAEQEAAGTQPTVCLVGDSPNLSRTVETIYGKGSRPDLAKVMQIARQYGQIYEAILIANPGLPRWVAAHYERSGYAVDFGLGPDCDDRVISKCVQAGLVADVLICMGGDHALVDVVRMVKLQRRPVKVVVIAVKEATAACLAESCDLFINLPVLVRAAAA